MADVYEMMMRIGLHGGALNDLLLISNRLTSIHKLSEDIGKSMTGWGKAVIGVAGIIGGAVLIGALEKALMKAKDFSTEIAKIQGLGADMAKAVISGEMTSRAFDISKRVGMKVEDLLKIPGFTYSIIGQEKSMEIWESLAKYSFSQRGDKGFQSGQGEALRSLLKAGELTGRITDPLTGHIDMDRLEKFLDMVQRIKAATHGSVNEATILGMAKQGGTFMRDLSEEGFLSMATISQALGGPRTGTAYMSLWNQMARGQMTAKTAAGMEEVGLLKSDEYTLGKGGTVNLSKEASQRLTALIGNDPMEMAHKLRETFKERGITDPQEQMRLTMGAFGRQTTQRFTAEEVANYEQLMAEKDRIKQGYSVAQSMDTIMKKDIGANMEALTNAWSNMMVAFAGPQSENFIKALQFITSTINSIQDSLRSVDPKTLTFISEGIAALGIALMAAGMLAVIAAIGPGGWLVAGFVALAAVNWDKLKGIATFIQTMSDILRKIDEWSSIKIPGWMQWGSAKPQNQSLEGSSPFNNSRIMPASFDPSNQKQILQPVNMNLNIDGRTLAQAVSEVLEDLYNHPTGSPSPDGFQKFRPQGNFTST